MSKLLSFSKGGIHPNDMKYLSHDAVIEKLPLFGSYAVPLSQHIGKPAKLSKQIGDHVFAGEKIAEADGVISSSIHSPVDGTIKEIKKVVLPSSVSSDAVVIIPDEMQTTKFDVKHNWKELSKEDLLGSIVDAGIVGQGGATFPAGVKLNVPSNCSIDSLIVNCVECEPYLTSDYRLVLEKTDEFLEGIEICQKIVNPKRVIIAIEANKIDLVDIIKRKLVNDYSSFEINVLKMKYPQGDEKQLIKACMNREVPSGKLPSDVGAVVINAGSVWAVYNAIVYKKPLFERIVTVSGSCIKNPSNFLALIGTSVNDIINYAGGFTTEPDKIISGGPMMGFAFYDLNTPVVKGTSGIICIKDEKDHRKTPCLSCGRCAAACPMGLEPNLMYRLITNGKYDEAMKNNLMDCKECGCCSYSCPAHLDLVQSFKLGKKMGRKK